MREDRLTHMDQSTWRWQPSQKGCRSAVFGIFYEKYSLISVLRYVEILRVIGMKIYGRYVHDLEHIKKYNHWNTLRMTISRMMQQSEQQRLMVLNRKTHYNGVLRSIIYQRHFNSELTLDLRYIRDRDTLDMLIFMMTVNIRMPNR